MFELESLIRLGGVVQVAICAASLAVPRVLDWRTRLARLDPFMRRLFWVYSAFTFGVNLSFGLLAWTGAEALAAGEGLGRSLALTIALYWLARWMLQWGALAPPEILASRIARWGHRALTVAFTYLAAVFGWAAVH